MQIHQISSQPYAPLTVGYAALCPDCQCSRMSRIDYVYDIDTHNSSHALFSFFLCPAVAAAVLLWSFDLYTFVMLERNKEINR